MPSEVHYLISDGPACKLTGSCRWTRIRKNVTCRQCSNILNGRA